MTEETRQNLPEDPKEAEPGRGAPGNNHYGVQMAQTIGVNDPEEVIPSNVDVEKNVKEVKALEEQEEGSGMETTGGYVLDEAGRLDNVAVEPEMYVEEK
ncbi:MAG: hypothetical protein KME06_05950 [Kastovskya adunca ATA6-11-RM4]|nr:hypothetical protein [Kastovskya adunca ATA6-11-RM4]